MDKDYIPNLIKSMMPELKAQIAEHLKVQGAENATFNFNINLHTGDNNYVTVNVPAGMNLSNIAFTEITPEIANNIRQKTLEDLSAQHPQFESLLGASEPSRIYLAQLTKSNANKLTSPLDSDTANQYHV